MVAVALLLGGAAAFLYWRSKNPGRDPNRPAIWIIGDSTVKSGKRGYVGWGDKLADHFDTNRIQVFNEAVPGKSSRTFYNEKWNKVFHRLLPGDFVLMQFGHNDASPTDDEKSRGTMPGIGEQERGIFNQRTGKPETIYTFGHYLRLFIEESRNRGAQPILCSYVPTLPPQPKAPYTEWTRQVAAQQKVPFLDLFALISAEYKKQSIPQLRDRLFVPLDKVHTNEAGATLNASIVAAAIRADEPKLAEYLR